MTPNNEKTPDIKKLTQRKKEQPFNPQIDYYLACEYLKSRNTIEFSKHAELYLFGQRKQDESTLLTRYYLARVRAKEGKFEQSISHIIQCLIVMPTMAELWCLAGDVFVKLKQYERAKALYENAILFGSQRLRDDPVEIDKYKDYPEKMIEAITHL